MWAAGTAAAAGYAALPYDSPVAGLVYVALGVCCNLAVVVGLRRHRPARRLPWYWLTTGLALSNLGNILWFAHRAGSAPDFLEWLSDGFYLACYPALGGAVFLFIRGRTSGRDRAGLLDAAIVSTGLTLLSWTFLMRPIVLDSELAPAERLVMLAYPAGDVLLIAMLVRLLATQGARTVSYWLLVAGLALQLVTDSAYAVLATTFGYSGAVVDAGWLLAYVCVAGAALHPSIRQASEVAPDQAPRMTRWRFALLTGTSLLAPGVLAMQGSTDPEHIDWPALTIGSIAMFLLVLARMWHLIAQVQDQAVQLAALARNDGLTGIPNRRAWDLELPAAMARASRTGHTVHVGLLDLDHFKRFNDANGHQAGDALLRHATAAWRGRLRDGDLLARYGGEEFAVLFSGASTGEALDILDRMRAVTPDGQSFSAGVAAWDGLETPQRLVNRADQALYAAKRDGRNRVVAADRPAGGREGPHAVPVASGARP